MTHRTRKLKYSVLVAMTVVAGTFAWAQGGRVSDESIASSIRHSYAYQAYLKDDSIGVSSKRGIVTLTGTVLNRTHKALAEDTAASTKGVKKVTNQLLTQQEREDDGSDLWIGNKVKASLMFHRHVNASKTRVSVENGVVTLEGEANSEAQRTLTAEYAKDVDGVQSVKNDLRVVNATEPNPTKLATAIDDASITAEVKMSLMYYRATSALRTHVTTKNGVVSVHGEANNLAEKELVTKLVNNIQGVTKVQNEMTVGK